jgi:hypothetical protein
MLNKQEFNKLDILDQVEYINNNIADTSLTKLCEAMGVNRSTITKRFKSKGFILENNQYISKHDNVNKSTTISKQTTKSKPDTDIIHRIEKLEALVNELVNNNNKVADNGNKQDLKSFIKFSKDIDVVVSYRLDHTTKERFKAFCSKHSEYKTKDILSSILNDFLDKFE